MTPDQINMGAVQPVDQADNYIDAAQNLRWDIISKLTTNGNRIDTDKDSVELLLRVLADSDRSEISRMKIKADQKNGEDDRKVAMALAQASVERQRMLGNRNPFEAIDITPVNNNIPTVDVKALPDIEVSEGLMARGHNIEGYDEFINRVGA